RFEQARALAERVGFRQQAAAAPQQVFTLRRQPDVATETVEQRHAQFGFQRANLSGKRRLAQIHSIGSAGEAAGIGNADEGAQVAQIHAADDNNFASMKERQMHWTHEPRGLYRFSPSEPREAPWPAFARLTFSARGCL